MILLDFEAFCDDILGSIKENMRLENITVSDAQMLLSYTLKLYHHLYSHYEEMGDINDMTDESFMTDADLIFKECEDRLNKAIAEHEAILAEREAAIAEKEATIVQMDASITEKDASIAEKDASIAEKDASIAEKDASIAEKDASIAEKDATLAERDAALAEKDALIASLQAQLDKFSKQ